MRVTRVYWYTDWVRGVRLALKELWRSLFGCHHDWATIRFQHVREGTWAVNECYKCKKLHPFATYSPFPTHTKNPRSSSRGGNGRG